MQGCHQYSLWQLCHLVQLRETFFLGCDISKALLPYQTWYPVLYAMSNSSANACAGLRNPAGSC